MDTTNEPIEIIKEWQDWYRKHRAITEIDQPLTTKDSHKTMHDTPNAVETLLDTDPKAMWIEKAKEHFADTLAEYQYELSGKDFYKAFYQAAYEHMEEAQKEYDKIKQLVDMLRYHQVGQG